LTLEEGLLALLSAVAGLLLFIGLAQALDSGPAGRRPVRVRARPRGSSGSLPGEAEPLALAGSGASTGARDGLELVEHAFSLYGAGRHEAVLEACTPALRLNRRSMESAALWSLVGLSRQWLGDMPGSRRALEAALRAAPAELAPAPPPALAVRAALVGRRLLSIGTRPVEQPEHRLPALGVAALWLGWGTTARLEDREVAGLLERARGTLDDCRESIATSFAEDVERAAAAGEGTDDRDTLAALAGLEARVQAVSDECLEPARRLDLTRQLWRGYSVLGRRWLEAGRFDAALELLSRALSLERLEEDGRRQTRALLGRAVDGLARRWTDDATVSLRRGDAVGAASARSRLRGLIEVGVEAGLAEEELTPVLTRTREIDQQILDQRGRERGAR